MSAPLTPVTYWSQLFEQKANLSVLGFVVAFFVIGLLLPGDGRSILWPGSLAILAVFFLMPWLHGEQRNARKAYQEALKARAAADTSTPPTTTI
jgi:hypothetical protein